MIWALVQAASGSRVRALEQLARRVSTPLPVRRRISLASLVRGCGTTSLTRELALMLARQRLDRLLVVSTADPDRSRLSRLEPPHTVRRLDSEYWNDPRGCWRDAVGDAQRVHDLTVTDWGAVPVSQLNHVASESHALCLVAPADRKVVQSSLDYAAELGKRVPVLMAVVDVRGEIGPSVRPLVRNLPVKTVLLRHDPRHHNGAPPPEQLREPEALQVYRLAADLIGALAGNRRNAG